MVDSNFYFTMLRVSGYLYQKRRMTDKGLHRLRGVRDLVWGAALTLVHETIPTSSFRSWLPDGM